MNEDAIFNCFAIYTLMVVLISIINGYLIARCIDALREERKDKGAKRGS